MAISTPVLNVITLDSSNPKYLIIGDVSTYGTYSANAPTIEIDVPNFGIVSLGFVKGSVQVYDSNTLGLTCGDECEPANLPDGIWKIKYSVYPAYKYYIERTFIRVDMLQSKFDTAYLKLDFVECDQQIKDQDKEFLFVVQEYINGAVAAANKCTNKLAMKLYRKANEQLDYFIKNHKYLK